ncbi:MAG: polysaccharide deacetylase family protein [Pseudomonadota bacterium]
MPEPSVQTEAPTRVVLKVDVDTKVGLLDGTRRLADILGELGIRASFFVAMGPDHSGRALKRVLRPGFLQKQMHSGAAAAYGPITMLYGLLLPGPIIAECAPGLLNRLINEGHEVGLHGWDHVYWHDRVRHLDAGRTRRQLDLAAGLFQKITGFSPASFASPGWQVNDAALLAMARMGLTHVSCTRGKSPFRPLVGGRVLPLIELPTTMPSLDEVLSLPQVTPATAARYLAEQVRPGRLNVFTLHGEVEGRQMAPAFRQFLDILLGRGVVFPRLIDAARQAARGPLPAEAIAWSTVPHRAGELAFQPSALAGAGQAA